MSAMKRTGKSPGTGKKRGIPKTLVILMLVFFWTCHAAAAEITATEKDAGSTVEIECGDTLSVFLAANPTTGYNWRVSSVDRAVLPEAGPPSYRRDSDLIGSGGMITLSFEAAAPGKTLLSIVYERPFERDVPPVRTFGLTVIVRPSK